METIIHKNRVRLNRGVLTDFNSLPEHAQNNFIRIKNSINNIKPNTKCYVMGSYYWGFWDDYSDYDVISELDLEGQDKVKEVISDIKFNILNIKRNTNIEIP
jgi:hypothetical protein